MLIRVPAVQWTQAAVGADTTMLRVGVVCVAFAWTVPAGVTIGLRPRLGAQSPRLRRGDTSVVDVGFRPVIQSAGRSIRQVWSGVSGARLAPTIPGKEWKLFPFLVLTRSSDSSPLGLPPGLLKA